MQIQTGISSVYFHYIMNQISLALIFICLLVTASSQVLTQIPLSTTTTGSLSPATYIYYNVLLQQVSNDSVLMVTVDSHDQHTYPEIFLSTTSQYPNITNSQTSCFGDSLNTCTRTNLSANSTIYISIYSYKECNYSLIVELTSIVPILQDRTYSVTFTDTASLVASFIIDQNYSEYVIIAEHTNFYFPGQYQIYEACDYVPGNQKYDRSAHNLGAFRKMIKLNANQIQINKTHYILLEGQIDVKLSLKGYGIFAGEEGNLILNNTRFDILHQPQNYTISIPITTDPNPLPLYIDLRSLNGYGIMNVTYCKNHSFLYQDTMGENAQLLVMSSDRIKCYADVINEGLGLLFEIINIEVKPQYYYGFQLQVYEGNNENKVRINQQQFGIISQNDTKNYTLQIFTIDAVNVSLITKVYLGVPVFLLSRCSNNICNPILLNSKSQFLYDPKACTNNCSLLLTVTTTELVSEYGFIFELLGYHIQLTQNKVDRNLIELDEYKYYNLTLYNSTGVTSLTVKLTTLSGSITMFTSRNNPLPTFLNSFGLLSDVKTSWNGTITYYSNFSAPLYIGLFGEMESTYSLGIIVHRYENIASNYQLLIDNTVNQYNMGNGSLLLRYSPHAIPYSIVITPPPACLTYSNQIPITSNCTTLPENLYEPVYINITDTSSTKFTVLVNTGHYTLTTNQPVFIQCQSECYQIITVIISKNQRVVLSGYGKLVNTETNETIYSSGVMSLNCSKAPCTNYLNASLSYAGSMIITMESDNIKQISYYSQTCSLNSLPNRFFYRFSKYSNESVVITFDSKGATLDVYANIQTINANYTNVMQLTYPTRNIFDLRHKGDPFSRVAMLEIESALLKQLGCYNDNEYCILTLSVYLNTDFEYSKQFLANGVFYVSATTYSYKLTENTPLRITSQYSTRYYQHTSAVPQNLTFILQPVSKCTPKMIYNNKSTQFPTLDNFTTVSFDKLSVSNVTRAVIGIISQQTCMYEIVMLNDMSYRFMIQGFPQTVTLKPKSTEYITFNAKYAANYFVESYFKIGIYANVVPYNQNASLYLPTPTASNYSAVTPPLLINNNESANYIIALVNTHDYTVTTDVLIKQSGQRVVLLHNMLYSESLPVNGTSSYIYYTANSFYIFITTSGGSYDLTVTNYNGLNKTFTFDNTTLDPFYFVQADPGFTSYYIQVVGRTQGKFTLEILQYGSEGRPTLLPGLPFFDTFSEFPQVNCYKAVGDPTIHTNMKLAFMYSQEYTNSLSKAEAVKVEPTFFYDFQPAKSNTNKSTPRIISVHTFSQGMSFELQQQYGTYTFCFQNQNNLSLFKQYDVILASNDMGYLIPTIPTFNQANTTSFNKYELLTTSNSTIVVQVITCQGKTQVTGASHYQDILDGHTTSILRHQSYPNSYFGNVNVSHGYFYIGVQTLINYTSYIVNTYVYPQSKKIVLSNWQLPEPNLKWHVDGHNLIVSLTPVKCVNSTHESKLPHIYTLYIANDSNILLSNARCGIKDPHHPVSTYKQTAQPGQTSTITFTVPLKALPKSFYMTSRVDINLTEVYEPRTVPYFYSNTQTITTEQLKSHTQGTSWELILFVIIVVVLSLLAALYFVCKKMQIGWFKPKQTVSFELATLNPTKDETRSPEKDERDGAPAYGEFVDQSKL